MFFFSLCNIFTYFFFSFKRPASFRLSAFLGKNGPGLDTKKKSSSMSNLTETRVGEIRSACVCLKANGVHLTTCPEGNSQFCSRESRVLPEEEGNIEIRGSASKGTSN